MAHSLCSNPYSQPDHRKTFFYGFPKFIGSALHDARHKNPAKTNFPLLEGAPQQIWNSGHNIKKYAKWVLGIFTFMDGSYVIYIYVRRSYFLSGHPQPSVIDHWLVWSLKQMNNLSWWGRSVHDWVALFILYGHMILAMCHCHYETHKDKFTNTSCFKDQTYNF